MILTTVIANLLATGSALLLMRRGPTPRLRLLVLTVGLMSLAQTASYIQAHGAWTPFSGVLADFDHLTVGALSLLAIYLLGQEIYDRRGTDRRLRLAEHALPVPQVEHMAQVHTESSRSATPSPQPQQTMG